MRKILIFSFLLLGLSAYIFLGGQGKVSAVEINPRLITSPAPGTHTPPGEIVNQIYLLALGISGLLAFGAIVYGAIVYTLAAGNPSGQNEGKEWVKQALLGLLLLAGAYIILNTINPELTDLSLKIGEEYRLRGGEQEERTDECQDSGDCPSLFCGQNQTPVCVPQTLGSGAAVNVCGCSEPTPPPPTPQGQSCVTAADCGGVSSLSCAPGSGVCRGSGGAATCQCI